MYECFRGFSHIYLKPSPKQKQLKNSPRNQSKIDIKPAKKAIKRAKKRLAEAFQNTDLVKGGLSNFESSFLPKLYFKAIEKDKIDAKGLAIPWPEISGAEP